MADICFSHKKVCITKTTYRKACPYCKKRIVIKKTCGERACQYKHHIITMRKRKRKTDQIRNKARIKL